MKTSRHLMAFCFGLAALQLGWAATPKRKVKVIAAVNEYKADNASSQVQWHADKVTGSHDGTIQLKDGLLKFQDQKLVGGEFVVDVATLNATDEDFKTDTKTKEKLEGHLKSKDFFNVETYPTSKFVITKVKALKGNLVEVTGDFTLLDQTHPLVFKAQIEQSSTNITSTADISIDRTKWGLKYGSTSFFKGLGDHAIKDKFLLKVKIVAKK